MKILILVLLMLAPRIFFSQGHGLKLDKTIEECSKAAAIIHFDQNRNPDSLQVQWSTGVNDVTFISELSHGDYSVHVRYIYRDTIRHVKDTTIFFTIIKEICPLSIPNYFSPNGDNYSDLFSITNISSYPKFEFIVYNKWGQRVHHQQGTFVPWDGKWLGIDLPDGAYYYILFYDKENTSEVLKGDLTILR